MDQTQVVPVSNPAHPSHREWLQILLIALKAVTDIGPAVVAIVDPGDAKEATQIGTLASTVESHI